VKDYAIGETMSDEDSLAHFGVKGMKWGQRRAAPDSSGVSKNDVRAAARAHGKQVGRNIEDFNDQDRKSRDAGIKEARSQRKQVNRDYHDAKSTIKAQRKTGELGKNAARMALNKAALERYEVIAKADQTTSGEAIANLIFAGLGAVARA
jgi:hypothetical protein